MHFLINRLHYLITNKRCLVTDLEYRIDIQLPDQTIVRAQIRTPPSPKIKYNPVNKYTRIYHPYF